MTKCASCGTDITRKTVRCVDCSATIAPLRAALALLGKGA